MTSINISSSNSILRSFTHYLSKSNHTQHRLPINFNRSTSSSSHSISSQSNQNQSKSHSIKPTEAEVDISLFSHLLDPHPSESGPYHQIFFGSKPPFEPLPDEVVRQSLGKGGNEMIIESLPPNSLTDRDIKSLHKYPLVVKRVVNQTGKGKIPSMYTLVVVGNGNGLVGYGEGKSETIGGASTKALRNAIRNLSPVNLFEGRTIHTELRSKFHATEIVMRPRPAGFGLRVNPFVHQVAKAAGISDLSAKVTRSNNPMNVIKLTLMMLQSGSAPIGMGDGFGGKGRRLEKGIGMRTGDGQ
ncbi:uncharacterized protein MELLADRAFT_89301 [Melampsora larici-populina 98AG31]|uniref:Small ribosomal subunit protein uS5m n=1 Tax=Melampsora larici-populina (strain 98AG31 / pathotype 3-4-7) TaxID=747676 RepID=F4R5N4_MELLP|nr:uncharacterized protein MELLADRAFT_89301 [Melampsora larici-populina 98AG31]EGG12233.1 hypothetical protein MELLADRAFT_89301 [Melampsora larici-populina 98AG31]